MKTPTANLSIFLLTCLVVFTGMSQTITTVAGTGISGFSGDGGNVLSAQFKTPRDVCFDASGNMYVADAGNHRIRKVTPGGTVSTFAGTGASGYSGDGGQATAADLNYPNYLFFDNNTGSLYFSSFGCTIRKINSAGIISTVVGTGSCSSGGGPIPSSGQATVTNFKGLSGMVIGPDKKMYFAELFSSLSRVYVLDTLGNYTVYAGGFNNPTHIMLDAAGNLYVCDSDNLQVKKVSPQGSITPVAGTWGAVGSGSNTGDGGPATSAKLDNPNAILMDAGGSFYIGSGPLIRVVNTSSIIGTFAGGGAVLGDGGPAILALVGVAGLAWGPNGNMYIAHASQNRIRMISPGTVTSIKNIDRESFAFAIYPNPASSVLNFSSTQLSNKNSKIVITDILGKQVMTTQTGDLNSAEINIAGLSNGLYYATIKCGEMELSQKFVKD